MHRYLWSDPPTEIEFTSDSIVAPQLGIDYRDAENYMICVAPVIRQCADRVACASSDDCANATSYCDARRRAPDAACSFWDDGAKCAAGAMVPVDMKVKFLLGLVVPHPKGTNDEKGTKTTCRHSGKYTHCSRKDVVMTCTEAWQQAFVCPERHWYRKDVPLVCGAATPLAANSDPMLDLHYDELVAEIERSAAINVNVREMRDPCMRY
jgi:hypothetical protein